MTSVEGRIAGFGEGMGDVKGIIVPCEDYFIEYMQPRMHLEHKRGLVCCLYT
jgi:hypothetical protein